MGSVQEGTEVQGGIARAGREQARHLSDLARGRLYTRVDSHRGDLARGLQGLASSLESAARGDEATAARPMLDNAAGLLRRTSDRLENGTTEELLEDMQERVRQRPGLVIAGSIAVGFLLGRLLKS